MTRLSVFNSPLLLGFEQLEQVLDRVSKASSDGYPPYNIEQIGDDRLRITLAVAGFSPNELSVRLENTQLIVQGRQKDDDSRTYIHRGIAARQFQRSFVLAEGLEVEGADMENGLLHIDLLRPSPESRQRKIEIKSSQAKNGSGKSRVGVSNEG
jgi:HSP20 family molecular chaperone IbpA